jgi:hypothetical protein
MPFHRQEDRTARLIDRGTMCSWAEELGALVGSGVAEAMRDEALRTAFCIPTDATGVLLQPIRGGDQQRRSCRRGPSSTSGSRASAACSVPLSATPIASAVRSPASSMTAGSS